MINKKPQDKKQRRRFGKPEEITNIIEKYLSRLGKSEQILLTRLWQHWDMVMGPEIANLAWPLGHRDGVLFVGGEDNMSIQELTYMHDEILERANAFMESNFFVAVKARLSLDKKPLDEAAYIPRPVRKHMIPDQTLSGKHLANMDPHSAVTKCYARFVALSKERE